MRRIHFVILFLMNAAVLSSNYFLEEEQREIFFYGSLSLSGLVALLYFTTYDMVQLFTVGRLPKSLDKYILIRNRQCFPKYLIDDTVKHRFMSSFGGAPQIGYVFFILYKFLHFTFDLFVGTIHRVLGLNGCYQSGLYYDRILNSNRFSLDHDSVVLFSWSPDSTLEDYFTAFNPITIVVVELMFRAEIEYKYVLGAALGLTVGIRSVVRMFRDLAIDKQIRMVEYSNAGGGASGYNRWSDERPERRRNRHQSITRRILAATPGARRRRTLKDRLESWD